MFLLKSPSTDLVVPTCSELQHWGSSLTGTRDIQEGTEVSGIRVRIGGVAFSMTEVLAEAVVPLLSPPLTELAGGHRIWISMNLGSTVLPTLVIT